MRQTLKVRRRLAVLGRGLNVATGRVMSAGLLLAALLVGAGLAVVARFRVRDCGH